MSQNLDSVSIPPGRGEPSSRSSGLAEDVDWSAVRSHKRVQRKYGPRTDTSTSSRSSISSGLTEEFSSSGSDTAEEDERGYRSSSRWRSPKQVNADTPPSGLFGKARHIWVKHRAKKLFLRFTTQSRQQTRTPAGRRLQDAADALIRIASEELGGEDIVARRFVKTLLRQKNGTNAILSLGAEECAPTGKTPGDITLQTSGVAARLLNLVVSHSKGSSFFSETFPSILRQDDPARFEPQASVAIPYLATVFPDQFDLTDPVLVQDFASSLVTGFRDPSLWWLRGIRILDILMNRALPNAPRQQEMKRLMAAKALGAVTQEFASPPVTDPQDIDLGGPTPQQGGLQYHPLRRSIPLRAVVSAIWIARDGAGALESILPDSQGLVRLAEWLESICTEPFDTDVGLALKALALLRDIPEVKVFLSTADLEDLAPCCVELVLYQFPREMTASWKSADFEMQELKPDEDAFDILCYLKEPEFAQALESKLKPPASKIDSLDSDLFDSFDSDPFDSLDSDPFDPLDSDPSDPLRLLEPLLWLSNMPSDIKIAHRALVQSGACNFLANIVPSRVSPTWTWEEREIWRAKGQAMTCLGNIIEKMDESQLREHVTKKMIDDVVAIKTNEEAPEAQRDQATFTLQRYQIAAGRSGIEPYYRELPNKPRGV